MSTTTHRYNTRSVTKAKASMQPNKAVTKSPLGPPPGFEHVIPTPRVQPAVQPTKQLIPGPLPKSPYTAYNIPLIQTPEVMGSSVYISHQLKANNKVHGTANKKHHASNIFLHLLNNHAILIQHPKFRFTVLKKAEEIATDCKRHARDLKQTELEKELDALQTKLTSRLHNIEHHARIKNHIADIRGMIAIANTEFKSEPLIDLCDAIKNLIINIIPSHPNYVP